MIFTDHAPFLFDLSPKPTKQLSFYRPSQTLGKKDF